MLTAISQSSNQKWLASAACKEDGPFICSGCGAEVFVKKGKIKTHHFAHRPPATCDLATGETCRHLMVKSAIYGKLLRTPGVTQLELEHRVGNSIADVFAVINDVPVAIEVQRSNLSVSMIQERTSRYAAMGVAAIWVCVQPPPRGKRCSPSAWQKWLHAAYMGRVYYWKHADTLVPVHYSSHYLWVEETDWGGGYSKRSKRYRSPNKGNHVSIGVDFSRVRRAAWDGGTVSIPACVLYQDTQPAWWYKEEN